MGILEFAKDVGAKLFGKDGKNESDTIRELLQKELGDKLQNLSVQYQQGVVTLSGQASSQADKEKALLLAGNVQGVEKVDGEQLTLPLAASVEREVTSESQFYTVERGDNLSAIAKKFYKDASKYKKILEANKEVIKDPDLIYPGQKLRIPEAAPLQS